MDAREQRLNSFVAEIYDNIRHQQKALYHAQSLNFAIVEALKETMPGFALIFEKKHHQYVQETSVAYDQLIRSLDEAIQRLKAGQV